jgi:hypothetical protein
MIVEGVPFPICDLCHNTAGRHTDPHLGTLCPDCRRHARRATQLLTHTPGIAAQALLPEANRNHQQPNNQ